MFIGKAESKVMPLIEFALGIEIAQVIIVFVVLFLGFFTQTIFRFSRRDWIMVLSAIVVGLVIPMLIESDIFSWFMVILQKFCKTLTLVRASS